MIFKSYSQKIIHPDIDEQKSNYKPTTTLNNVVAQCNFIDFGAPDNKNHKKGIGKNFIIWSAVMSYYRNKDSLNSFWLNLIQTYNKPHFITQSVCFSFRTMCLFSFIGFSIILRLINHGTSSSFLLLHFFTISSRTSISVRTIIMKKNYKCMRACNRR